MFAAERVRVMIGDFHFCCWQRFIILLKHHFLEMMTRNKKNITFLPVQKQEAQYFK
tara:strand:+ start:217 stop:384 length:168 start_codon:yes stop_codon:yes gene_type:complete